MSRLDQLKRIIQLQRLHSQLYTTRFGRLVSSSSLCRGPGEDVPSISEQQLLDAL